MPPGKWSSAGWQSEIRQMAKWNLPAGKMTFARPAGQSGICQLADGWQIDFASLQVRSASRRSEVFVGQLASAKNKKKRLQTGIFPLTTSWAQGLPCWVRGIRCLLPQAGPAPRSRGLRSGGFLMNSVGTGVSIESRGGFSEEELLSAAELERLQQQTKRRVIQCQVELRSIRRFILVPPPSLA